ncbi:MAG TPA: Rieske (2Fe-2S) protein [Steroidobacteraceae bacterium]|nr:Rieske (2Fe-2S) protein [Steroidobacteraceae bacterium]
MNRWFAVSACGEVPHGAVAHTQLLGQELVLWRSASGALNAWENRCPHRGVRLTLGDCVGEELRCQYHAWRFATGSGHCTHIPAHPGQKPASNIRARVYPVFEDGAFIWVNLAHDAVPPNAAAAPPGLALRSIFTRAPVAAVTGQLLHGYADHAVCLVDEFTLDVAPAAHRSVRFMLQPVTGEQCILHAHLHGEVTALERLSVLKVHNALMSAVRDRAEAARA